MVPYSTYAPVGVQKTAVPKDAEAHQEFRLPVVVCVQTWASSALCTLTGHGSRNLIRALTPPGVTLSALAKSCGNPHPGLSGRDGSPVRFGLSALLPLLC